MRKILLFTFFIYSLQVVGQQVESPIEIILPDGDEWQTIEEGQTLKIRLSATGGSDVNYSFGFRSEKSGSMKVDEVGNFRWATGYDVVQGASRQENVQILFFVQNDSLERDSVFVDFTVMRKVEENISSAMKFVFPDDVGWHLLDEGDTLSFPMEVSDGRKTLPNFSFYMEGDAGTGITIDSNNVFSWIPSYSFVDRLQQTRDQHVVFIAEDPSGNTISKKIEFTVFHKNRPPVISQTPIIYVLQNTNNVFQLSGNYVKDPDDDPVVAIPVVEQLPQGATLNSKGVFQWKPSRRQFRSLLTNPEKISFYVEDQPYKARVKGELVIMPSQKDMPPEITVIPSDTMFVIDEDKYLNINFYLSDPNGDDDIPTFNFVSDDIRVPKESLRENNAMQYEFVWKPGYDFVSEMDEYLDLSLRFFAIDRSQQNAEKTIRVRVNGVENLDLVDEEAYNLYYAMLVNMMNEIDHLNENQKKLEKEMRKAKKGKKNRAIMTAGFGAVTGLSPLLLEDDSQKAVSAVGGTTVLTMGTLEAKDAVGTSIDEVNERLKVNVNLRNKLTNEGDAFARRYNSRIARRGDNFALDIDRLKTTLNDPDFIKLQLDATWENPNKPSIRRLSKTFIDFKPFASE